jgi:arsenic resistance protein ArsH
MSSGLDLSLPNIVEDHLQMPDLAKLGIPGASQHPPRILLL